MNQHDFNKSELARHGNSQRFFRSRVASMGQLLAFLAISSCLVAVATGAAEDSKAIASVALEPAGSPAWLARLTDWHRMIKPQRGEAQYEQVPWANNVAAARNLAAKEGKPLLIWYMVGEPLGQC